MTLPGRVSDCERERCNVFGTEIWTNRRPGGNGAVSDQPTDGEQVATMIRKLQGSAGGWLQISGAGKFMTLTAEGDHFLVIVTLTGSKPARRWGIGKVDLDRAIEAAKRFLDTGDLHDKYQWAAA